MQVGDFATIVYRQQVRPNLFHPYVYTFTSSAANKSVYRMDGAVHC